LAKLRFSIFPPAERGSGVEFANDSASVANCVTKDPRLFLPSLGTTTAPAFDCTNKGRRAVSVRRGTP